MCLFYVIYFSFLLQWDGFWLYSKYFEGVLFFLLWRSLVSVPGMTLRCFTWSLKVNTKKLKQNKTKVLINYDIWVTWPRIKMPIYTHCRGSGKSLNFGFYVLTEFLQKLVSLFVCFLGRFTCFYLWYLSPFMSKKITCIITEYTTSTNLLYISNGL